MTTNPNSIISVKLPYQNPVTHQVETITCDIFEPQKYYQIFNTSVENIKAYEKSSNPGQKYHGLYETTPTKTIKDIDAEKQLFHQIIHRLMSGDYSDIIDNFSKITTTKSGKFRKNSVVPIFAIKSITLFQAESYGNAWSTHFLKLRVTKPTTIKVEFDYGTKFRYR